MASVEVSHLRYVLADGRVLLRDVSFRVGGGVTAALVGPNGAGKTTLLRLIAGDIAPAGGTISTTGSLAVMQQFVGSIREPITVRDLLLSVASAAVRAAAAVLAAAEEDLERVGDEPAQLRYAQALSDFADVGGYDVEVLWDTCTTSALGQPFDAVRNRMVSTLSGGEQKRLVLEALLRGDDDVLLLDEPDNYLDVPRKEWLEEQLASTSKAVLFVSHDRQLLARAADRIITVEDGAAWVHGGGFAEYAAARRRRFERMEELQRRWDEERDHLRRFVNDMRQKALRSDTLAPAYHAARSRLRRFEEQGPPAAPPREQRITMRLRGGRTGRRAVMCEQLALVGLTDPFDLEIWFGERVAVLGPNGTGKSHFLRLLGQTGTDEEGSVLHTGSVRLGARVVPGHFVQTHTRPEWYDRTPVDIVRSTHDCSVGEAMAALARYELAHAATQPFETLSGGQQARLQILALELEGVTLLLLDEPTDNLDMASADALQTALEGFEGTVIAVTHDRWFAAGFDRFLHFADGGFVAETPEPAWHGNS